MGFDQYIDKILEFEGGLTNDPKDPGGLTNFGIDQRDHPGVDIKNLTLEQAKQIYFKDYWLKYYCHLLPDELQLAYFDCSVNQGGPTAIKLLQKCFGITADGEWGPVTQSYAEGFKNLKQDQKLKIMEDFIARRMYRYGVNQLFVDFGLGWSRRLAEVARLTFSIRGW